MTTIKLDAQASYGLSGQYIARITGRAAKVQFAREFVGTKYGKRREGTSYETDEAGLYEECDVDKHGKKKSFALVLPYKDTLRKLYTDTDDALIIAKRLDAGEHLEDFVNFGRGEPLTDSQGYTACSVCDRELADGECCTEHPEGYRAGKSRQVPRLNDDGTPKYALVYTIQTKAEVKTEQAAATVDSAVAAIIAVLQVLPEPQQRKVLALVKGHVKLFAKPEPAIVAVAGV